MQSPQRVRLRPRANIKSRPRAFIAQSTLPMRLRCVKVSRKLDEAQTRSTSGNRGGAMFDPCDSTASLTGAVGALGGWLFLD